MTESLEEGASGAATSTVGRSGMFIAGMSDGAIDGPKSALKNEITNKLGKHKKYFVLK